MRDARDKEGGHRDKERGHRDKERGARDKERGARDQEGGHRDKEGGHRDKEGGHRDKEGGHRDKEGGHRDKEGGHRDKEGGHRDKEGGHRDKEGGHRDKEGGHRDQEGGHRDKEGGHRDKEGGHQDKEGGHRDKEGGHRDKEGGHRDQEGGHRDKEGGHRDKEGGHRDQEGGHRDQEGGHRDQEGGHRDQEGGHRDQEGGHRDQEGGHRDQEGGHRDQEGGHRDQERGARDQEGGHRDKEGGHRDQEGGHRDKEGGHRDKEGGHRDQEGGHRDKEGGHRDYERSTDYLGTWGRFQKVVFFFFCISMVPNGFSLAIIFVSATPTHRCFIPAVNLTQDWIQAIIPVQGFSPEDVNLTALPQEPCEDGWSYSQDIYSSTIVSEFDLVCGDQWKQPFTTTVHYMGIFVGSFFLGQASDRFGRKPVFFVSMVLQSFFMVLQVFSSSWVMFTILWFLSGLGNIANYVSAFVIGAEVLCGKVRVVFLTLGVGLGFASGYTLLPLIAFFLRDWRSLQTTVALPSLLCLPFWWVIPESPRWLLSQGRVREAEIIVRKAANMNRVKSPPVIFKDYASGPESKMEDRVTVLDLFRTRNIRTATVVLSLLWLTMSCGYYGVTLNSASLTPDPYLGCFISAVVEIPAYVATWFALARVPRRHCTTGAMLLGGVSLLLLPAIPPGLRWLSVSMETVAKFCFAASTNILFAFTAEVFPTVLRNTATGVCSTAARIGSCLAPYVLQLGLSSKVVPPVLLGSLSAASALFALLLPETFHQPLPETLADMQPCQRILCLKSGNKNSIKNKETKL